MADLIDRQTVIDEIKSVYEWHDTVTMERLIEHLNNLPSAEAEPVRHGHWIYTPTSPLGFTCSECGKEMCRFNYCPHCGALMNEVT